MTVMLLGAAFLCGVPFGIILGMVLVWRMNDPERDPDYSGGV